MPIIIILASDAGGGYQESQVIESVLNQWGSEMVLQRLSNPCIIYAPVVMMLEWYTSLSSGFDNIQIKWSILSRRSKIAAIPHEHGINRMMYEFEIKKL